MTPLFPAQRAAEEFDRVLAGTATTAVADRYADLLDTVEVLRGQPEVEPRAAFVGDLRSRLMTAAETDLVKAPAVIRQLPTTSAGTRRRRRLGTAAATLVIVGGSAGMAAAASGALPGETLYPVKLGIEQVRSATSLSDAGQGRALLDRASTRLEEVRALQAQDAPDTELVTATVESFRDAARSGSDKLFGAYRSSGDTSDISTVRAFTAQQMAHVAEMADASGAGSAGALVDAADTLADIDQEARVLCGSCDDAPALLPPPALTAGAGALAMNNLLARPAAQAELDVEQAAAARVAYLKAVAEKKAGDIPKIPTGTALGAAGSPSLPGSKAPVTSTITKDGSLLPVVSTGVAVKDLVSGVTTSVTDLATTAVPPATPLGAGVKGLTDTVDKTVDSTLDGLIPRP